jgi:hypothetical protein
MGSGLVTVLCLAACGTQPTDDATGGTRAAVEATGRCEVVPPFVPNFEPELKWQWTGSTVLPDHKQVMMTPVVVDVSGDGVPDVVFNTFVRGGYSANGVLRAISGADGSDLWTVTDPAYRVRGASSIAAGDIDHDGKVELCTVPQSGTGIICFEHDGTFKFRTTVSTNNWGGPSFADLDGDGTVEILNGNVVFSNTGVLLWTGVDGMGGQGATGPISFAADIDGEGKQEVINGRAIYRHDGTLLCRNPQIGHGLAGAGNFDADPFGEVVVVWNGRVSLMDHDCSLLWTTSLPGGGSGGAPNIADFDNDGQVEIGVAGASRYSVFETDGSVKWSSATRDHSSNVTGSSTFDFEGDGKAEVVYADEVRLRIYDGATGMIRFDVPHSSGTTYENPVVVDVDGDDNAEIVIASNNFAFAGVAGIRVFRDKKDGWVNTRRIWNQHAYSVTNVNDDGTIPAHPPSNWRVSGLNTFRSNSQGNGSTSPFAASDLTASEVSSACDRGTQTLRLRARVDNLGDAAASGGLKVAFYAGNPGAGGTLLGVTTVTTVLEASASTYVTLELHPAPGGLTHVFAVADDDGTGTGRETECNEENNIGYAQVNLTCVSNLPPVALCRDVTVSAGAMCQGSVSVDDGSYDPDNQPAPLSLSESPAGPFGLGSHPVTLTAFDGLERAQCVGTLTVVDTTPPAITCPAPQVLECRDLGAVASYSAQATDNCGPVPTSCTPPSGSTFPLGQTPVSCSATDGSGNAASCGFSVTVRDTTPPVLGGEKGHSLWSPNHKYATVTLEDCAANAQDACHGELPLNQHGRITRVTSDEVEDDHGNGDGRTCQDILLTSGATSVQVRSEREGTSNGRVYTLHYTVTDASGNSTSGSCRVGVPHDQSGRAAVDDGVKYCVGSGCPDGTQGGPLCR